MPTTLDLALRMRADEIYWSVAVRNIFRRGKLRTLGDVACWSGDALIRHFKGFGATRLAEVEAHLFRHGLRLGMRGEIAMTREGWVHIGPSLVPGIVEDRPAPWKGERRTNPPTPVEAEFLRASAHAFFGSHWDRAREAFRTGRFGEEDLSWFLDLYERMDEEIAAYDLHRLQSEAASD